MLLKPQNPFPAHADPLHGCQRFTHRLPDGNTLSIAVVIAVEADFEAVGAIIDTVEVVA